MARNKPFGFETIQFRLAGTIARYRELDRRLADHLAGHAQHIPALGSGESGVIQSEDTARKYI